MEKCNKLIIHNTSLQFKVNSTFIVMKILYFTVNAPPGVVCETK